MPYFFLYHFSLILLIIRIFIVILEDFYNHFISKQF